MSDVTLDPITSGYNLSKVNSNFDKVEQKINEEIVHLVGGNNVMLQDLDMNSNSLLNVAVDLTDPGSLLTLGVADDRYYNVDGDTLRGTMNVNGQSITGLKAPVAPTDPVRKIELDSEANARATADASLQNQLLGVNPPMGSEFSIISWHDQSILNSINIPANKNAWSFGPVLTLATGQVVTIGANSFWTIANGATTGSGSLEAEVPAPLDFGEL